MHRTLPILADLSLQTGTDRGRAILMPLTPWSKEGSTLRELKA